MPIQPLHQHVESTNVYPVHGSGEEVLTLAKMSEYIFVWLARIVFHHTFCSKNFMEFQFAICV